MRDLVLIVVVVVFCVLASFSTHAKITTIRCNDADGSVRIMFNTTNPSTVIVNNEEYQYIDGTTVGDVDKMWYKGDTGIMKVEFILKNDKVISSTAKGTAPHTAFKGGKCK